MPDTIMVVDDNENATRMTARMLSGTRVRGDDRTRRAERAGADRHPPSRLHPARHHDADMSGLEVLARLKHDPATTAIPVIMLTAKSQDDDVLTGYKEGAEYYITKPCSSRDLVYGIRLVLGKQREAAPAGR